MTQLPFLEPTAKSQEIRKLLTELSDGVEHDGKQCVICLTDRVLAINFRDGLSVKEFQISGMCQDCQDDIFG